MAFLLTLVLFAAAFALHEIKASKTKLENARPAELGDFSFPTATEQRKEPILWGTSRLKGPNVVWYGDLRQIAIKERVKVSLLTKKTVIKGYKYAIGLQLGLCRGAGNATTAEEFRLLKWFVDDEVVFDGTQGEGSINIDLPDLFGGDDLGAGGMVGTLYVRIGTETQTSPSYLAQFQQSGSGATPGYRGSVNFVWDGIIGNRTSIPPWSFEGRRIPNGLGLATPTVNAGFDANPMNCIYEIITNDEWGYGFGSADIDMAAFEDAAEVLRLEGNGISFLWDTAREIGDVLREIERQIDGVVYIDRSTGKWTVALARGGYDIDTIPQITSADVLEIRDFRRQSWTDTDNSVQVSFAHRGRDYTGTYAPAVDHGNIFIQGGAVRDSILNYPMVKEPNLANDIAWRDLRTISTPLAIAKLVVDRSYYALNPVDVIAWTDDDLGITKMPMRVTRIDLGELDSNKITLDVVEDVFQYDEGSFAAPNSGDWTPPSDTLVAIPSNDSAIFEAPRAFMRIDSESTSLDVQRIWAGARSQGDGAVAFNILDDSSGGYTVGGEVYGFMFIGTLASTISKAGESDGVSDSAITLTASPDSQSLILAALAAVTDADIGADLANLALVGNEIIGFQSASANGGGIDLDVVYRGLLDTAQTEHASGTRVYLLSVGGNLTDRLYDDASVNVRLQPKSSLDTLAAGSATTVAVTLANRSRRPYLPSRFTTNGDYWPTDVDLDATDPGSGLDSVGIRLVLTRRDYRLTDEVAALDQDAAALDPSFPAANDTRYLVEVVEDPDGSPTTLFTTSEDTGPTIDLSRTRILAANSGVVPARLEVRVRARHDDGTVIRDSLYTLDHAFDTTSADLAGLDVLGAIDTNVVSASFLADETGTYTFTLGTALPSGNVQARINGGSFVNVVTSGTSGTLPGVTAGDTVEIRHTDVTAGVQTICLISAPSTDDEAFAVLVT